MEVSWKDYVDSRLASTEEAVNKAESQLRDRLEGMNMIREQLRDQAALFAPRELVELHLRQADSAHEKLAERISDLERCQANTAGRSWMLWATLGVGLTMLSIALRFLIP